MGSCLSSNDSSWHPQLLTLVRLTEEGQPSHVELIAVMAQLSSSADRVPTLASVIEGELAEMYEQAEARRVALEFLARKMGVMAVVHTLVAETVEKGLQALLQPTPNVPAMLRPNTLLLGWPRQWPKRVLKGAMEWADVFVDALFDAHAVEMAVLVCKNMDTYPTEQDKVITGRVDVWWLPPDHADELVFSVIKWLHKHPTWRRCSVRVLVGVDPSRIVPARVTEFVALTLRRHGIRASVVQVSLQVEEPPTHASLVPHTHIQELPVVSGGASPSLRAALNRRQQLNRRGLTATIRDPMASSSHSLAALEGGGPTADDARRRVHFADTVELISYVLDSVTADPERPSPHLGPPATPPVLSTFNLDMGESLLAEADGGASGSGVDGEARRPSSADPAEIRFSPDDFLQPARDLNSAVVAYSQDADLVLLGLPEPSEMHPPVYYLDYVEKLTANLKCVWLVRDGLRRE